MPLLPHGQDVDTSYVEQVEALLSLAGAASNDEDLLQAQAKATVHCRTHVTRHLHACSQESYMQVRKAAREGLDHADEAEPPKKKAKAAKAKAKGKAKAKARGKVSQALENEAEGSSMQPTKSKGDQAAEAKRSNRASQSTGDQPAEAKRSNQPTESTGDQPAEAKPSNQATESTGDQPAEAKPSNQATESTGDQPAEANCKSSNQPTESTGDQPAEAKACRSRTSISRQAKTQATSAWRRRNP